MERNLLTLRCLLFLQHVAVIAGKGNHGVNIALHKPARQSSNSNVAGKAVDGGFNNSMQANSCTLTCRLFWCRKPAWWEVDLQGNHIIGNIRILNRDTSVFCLHDVTIDVFENKDKPRMKKHCITHAGSAGPGWLNMTCDSPVRGRYVRITKPKADQYDVLTLCEVEIYEANTANMKRTSVPCKLFRGMSMSGEDRTLMTRSLLHCASVCGATTRCKGFRVSGEERQNQWKERQVLMESGITVFRFY